MGKLLKLREGIYVTNNKVNANWCNLDYGIGKVTSMTPTQVTVATIKPRVFQNAVILDSSSTEGTIIESIMGHLHLSSLAINSSKY